MSDQSKVDPVKKFKELVDYAFDHLFQNSVQVKAIKILIQTASIASSTFIIRHVGPFLFKFREEIKKKDIDHFIKWDYADQMADWCAILNISQATAEGFRDAIRDSISKMEEKKGAIMIQIVTNLLKYYCKYVQDEKIATAKTAK